MSDFNPGTGWREVPVDMAQPEGTEVIMTGRYGDLGGPSSRWFVPEAPVPPLPTEPGYYIDDTGCAWRLDAGTWDDTFGNPLEDTGEAMQLPLTPYEPRAVTAKAVIDRAIELAIIVRRDVADTIRAEFGVES